MNQAHQVIYTTNQVCIYSGTCLIQGNMLYCIGCRNTQVFILVNKNTLGP
jgi:hypothetical protein